MSLEAGEGASLKDPGDDTGLAGKSSGPRGEAAPSSLPPTARPGASLTLALARLAAGAAAPASTRLLLYEVRFRT